MKIWESIKKFFSERGRIGDKPLHMFLSALLTVGLVVLARSNGHHPFNGVIIAFIVGLLKELYDLARHRGWDWYDVAANAIGCAIGALFTGAWIA
jgi:hypothetical protein